MKIHLMRSTRTTWCGRSLDCDNPVGHVSRENVTHSVFDATCKTCLKADAAEQLRNA